MKITLYFCFNDSILEDDNLFLSKSFNSSTSPTGFPSSLSYNIYSIFKLFLFWLIYNTLSYITIATWNNKTKTNSPLNCFVSISTAPKVASLIIVV